MEICLEKIKIDNAWKEFLKEEFLKPYFLEIKTHYINALNERKTIYPPANLIFNAFNLTPLQNLKIILLGQDPYHNPHQAMGLSFSVPIGVKIPPSLLNIYKELQDDLNIPIAKHGDLSKWAKQGILLLNSILSVEANKPASHAHFGWQKFTDAVISKLSNEKEGLIFLLWGNYAKNKKNLINPQKHFILETAHPSPLARNAFLGCKHFSKSNEILSKLGKSLIDWNLNP
ncbi:uracil-DNA glycosylase [Campylobacter sp. CNRCH_2016_0050h]|uniref:uracil-DNA glycosylase n=1 Tax=Campylobacter sp. CNRCH_2016_0050h TaxID=2911608 RepID=UPI0021E63357|nr:uracil-DNA glycosylase [Campylobacter sp. CNRCH_2016_0050h]MCV3456528.1 uracil-DNA glycosylase [Campylobacter sp. CNRCH_2016_0050h]